MNYITIAPNQTEHRDPPHPPPIVNSSLVWFPLKYKISI